jgi:hypothetical protein
VDMEDPKLREAAESLGRDLVKDETPAGPLRHVVIVALAGEGEDERLAIGGSNGQDHRDGNVEPRAKHRFHAG